jgi:2-keto-3-deoxy-L-rhamnonate aldolase RhmA
VGRLPGGYRNTINDNVVLILMIETLEGLKNAGEIAKVPGVHATSSDLGNFARYKLAKRPELRARSVRSENRHTR